MVTQRYSSHASARRDEPPALQSLTSAYNFAPLAHQVVCPQWQDRVSHDLPLREGLCAELDIELTAHTPLLVGAERDPARQPGGVQHVHFHAHPDGTPAIPGSALRGMLRNVLEVATFSRMALLDDRALSVRDLTKSHSDYMRMFVAGDIRDASQGAAARSRAGWLWFDQQHWRLESAAMARIEQEDLCNHFGIDYQQWPEHGSKDKRAWRVTARHKYELLRQAAVADPHLARIDGRGHLHVRFELVAGDVHRHSDGKFLRYKRVARLRTQEVPATATGKPAGMPGVLVVTGQGMPGKHMEFVFAACARKSDARVLDAETMERFRQVYAHADSDWTTHWAARAAQGDPVPVFFLETEGRMYIGLSQMFRVPGPRSLGEIARRQQAEPDPKLPLDFVQTLFGHVGGAGADTALKGRVFVGDLRWSGSPQGRTVLADQRFMQPTVLAQPKPAFYPAYLEQQHQAGQLRGGSYATVLSDDAKLSGWKRYPVRPLKSASCPPPPHKSRPDAQIALRPLAQDNRFAGRIRLHNVTPEELGAVVWALTWGGNPALRHALGLGKPFGLGQVSIRLTHADAPDALRANDPAVQPPSVQQCLQTFTAYMEQQVPGWARSESLRELLAMADPSLPQANADNLSPPRFEVGMGNEFVAAKKGGLALERHSRTRR